MAASCMPSSSTCCESSSSQSVDLLDTTAATTSSSSAHHDIFLSHSGAQKGFVKDLYEMLSPTYTPFFDITHHSLPPAENFPERIFDAAKTCKLAIIVLSEEFVCSRWPMLELCAFIKAMPFVKILPLFYTLSPADLTKPINLEKWHNIWEAKALAKSEPASRIVVSECEHALNIVKLQGGLVYNPFEGYTTYLKQVYSSICGIVPPAIKYEHWGIHGRDRLCKIILAEFEKLDSTTLQSLDVASRCSTCVLGMYGLPGAGKSTLSKCLHDHFFPQFNGKSYYLELPTNPTLDQLFNKCKELLNNLTGFHNMVNLTKNATDVRQLLYLLKTNNLQGPKIFLAVDNISSQESVEFVQHILSFGLGIGSKVLLVARTLDVLRPLLHDYPDKWHYVCGSMHIPSIDEEEAIQILLQSGGGLKSFTPEDGLTSRHVPEIIKKVVCMSCFGGEHCYIPLVLKIMGALLRQYEFDVEKWGIELQSFWRKVEVCKEDAVRQLVQESFEKLPEQLQLLFLDVALFVLPSSHGSMDGVYDLLSIMHESSPERIEMEMHYLQRHCFLESDHQQNLIKVHDVFLEFAASIPQSSMYYLSSGYHWRTFCNKKVADRLAITELSYPLDQANASKLRAIFLEQDDDCRRLDLSASCFLSVKALMLRNFASLEILGLAGLTSLMSLEIENCPNLKWVEVATSSNSTDHIYMCSQRLKRPRWANQEADEASQRLKRPRWANKEDEASQRSLKRLRWANHESDAAKENMEHGKNSLWTQLQQRGQQALHKISTTWSNMLSMTLQHQKRMIEVGGFASQFTGLQILNLENTGVKSLGDMSRCWPQLQELKLFERQLQHFELGSLPKLKRFLYSDGSSELLKGPYTYKSASGTGNARALGGENLFRGCPELEEVRVRSCNSFEEGLGSLIGASKLHTLWIRNSSCHPTSVPNLAAAFPQFLEHLVVTDCSDLRNVDFARRSESLRNVRLLNCPSLVEITGLDCLPSLQYLEVCGCSKLQTLKGLSGLVSLESLKIRWECPNVRVSLNELENLARLKHIDCRCECFVGSFNVSNLVDLEQMEIDNFEVGTFAGLERLSNLERLRLSSSSAEVKYGGSVDMANLLGLPNPYDLRLCNFQSLRQLTLYGLQNVASLGGIEILHALKNLNLVNLPNLTCMQGIQFLIHLEMIILDGCASVKELPSLCALVNMVTLWITGCVKLKALEGCDAMARLRDALFGGCKSLESLPLDHESLRQMYSQPSNTDISLRIEGCKFASVDATVAWAVDESVPVLLREASLIALIWEFDTNLFEKPRERRALGVLLVEKVVAHFVDRMSEANIEEHCLAKLEDWANVLEEEWQIFGNRGSQLESGHWRNGGGRKPEELIELLHGLAKVPKEEVLHKGQYDTDFQLSVVDQHLAQMSGYAVQRCINLTGKRRMLEGLTV